MCVDPTNCDGGCSECMNETITRLRAELEQEKRLLLAAVKDYNRVCAELEQARAKLAMVMEFCKNEPDDNERLVFAEDIRDILSDTRKPLAVVDGWAYDDVASDNLWTREGWAGITPEHDTDQQRPVRVIVMKGGE